MKNYNFLSLTGLKIFKKRLEREKAEKILSTVYSHCAQVRMRGHNNNNENLHLRSNLNSNLGSTSSSSTNNTTPTGSVSPNSINSLNHMFYSNTFNNQLADPYGIGQMNQFSNPMSNSNLAQQSQANYYASRMYEQFNNSYFSNTVNTHSHNHNNALANNQNIQRSNCQYGTLLPQTQPQVNLGTSTGKYLKI